LRDGALVAVTDLVLYCGHYCLGLANEVAHYSWARRRY